MLGKLISHRTEGAEIKITFEKGEAALRVLTPEIINVFWPRETRDHRSKAIEGEKAQKVTFTVKQDGEALVIATEKLTAKVYDDFYVDFYNADGTPAPRTQKILGHTPMGRFGEPEDLYGTLLWLADKSLSGFVTGITVAVDGGFSAYGDCPG